MYSLFCGSASSLYTVYLKYQNLCHNRHGNSVFSCVNSFLNRPIVPSSASLTEQSCYVDLFPLGSGFVPPDLFPLEMQVEKLEGF